MKDIPYFAIGNDEIEKGAPIKKGDKIKCPRCGKKHIIKYGKDERGKETGMLAFYNCGKETYLAGINGHSILNEGKL